MSNELVTLKIAAGLPALPGQADVAAAFLESLTAETRRAYGADLNDFARFLRMDDSAAAATMLWGLTRGQANAYALGYRTDMTTRGLAPSTIRRRLSALRSIVAFARTIGEIDWSLDVKSPRVVPYRDTTGPGGDGWLAMLAKAKASAKLGTAKGGTAKGQRDLALST